MGVHLRGDPGRDPLCRARAAVGGERQHRAPPRAGQLPAGQRTKQPPVAGAGSHQPLPHQRYAVAHEVSEGDAVEVARVVANGVLQIEGCRGWSRIKAPGELLGVVLGTHSAPTAVTGKCLGGVRADAYTYTTASRRPSILAYAR